ncbi:Interphotoreceptor matrix proteoglycan 2 [Liparis tanakae]|uniref:Interphotoreceptor matrix proteoglycan 2 n=1 Tax=Liparis tanakae TaxID=230148 RepID=A0A4Z2E161_9TELE|nr:Interphotoreceptor matrix proteoglycan 2 [Liparis tanakae]
MYESEATTGYSHYYRRYPEAPAHGSSSAEASTEFSSEEIRHIYQNSELTKEVCVCVCVCVWGGPAIRRLLQKVYQGLYSFSFTSLSLLNSDML